ncbi:MAG TPA: peptidylprolyl isomerase, partial [Gammaproteobacteria bacterium]|nr:peptidylprolyl isomerase [Gammaproteobacteria bacterium]
REQLRRGLADSAFVSDWEVAEALSVLEQRRDMAYLTLDIEEAQQRVEVSEDAIQTRYQEESIRFQTPRTVDAEFLVVSVDELMKQVPAAAEQELQDIYDADREASLTQGERDSAHILVLVNEQRDDAAALALTEQIAAQLAAGEEFATLAGEYSEDPGSAAQGGELGVAGKGIYDQAFEDALWALEEPGALSGPVRSEYGYHLIKLNDIVETEYPSFDEQRERIAAELARDEAESIFVETVDRLERLAYEERYSLLDTAAEMGMTVQTLSGLPEGASLADVA